MSQAIKKKKYGQDVNKPDCFKRLEKWMRNVPVVDDVNRIILRNMLEADNQDKITFMKLLRNIHADYIAHHSDYLPVPDDEKAWDDLNTLDLIMLDLCQVTYDALAHTMGEPYLQDVLRTESDEHFAESPLGCDSGSVAVNDGLPF